MNQHFRDAGRSRSSSPRAQAYQKEDHPYHPKNLYGDIQTDNHQIDSPKGGSSPVLRCLLQDFSDTEVEKEQNNGPGGSAEPKAPTIGLRVSQRVGATHLQWRQC